jgi:predicted transcriptional regulator
MLHLREWRHKRGLSVRKLGERAGVHFVSVARLEVGTYDPRLSTLRKLAKALNITVCELIGEAPKKGGRSYGTHQTQG